MDRISLMGNETAIARTKKGCPFVNISKEKADRHTDSDLNERPDYIKGVSISKSHDFWRIGLVVQ
jgi:hypothetical protein